MTLLFVCISRPFLCHTAFFVLMFFLKRKTYNQSGKKCNHLSLCASYLRRKPGSLKYSCESGSKRLPGSHDASQNRRSLGEAT